MHRRGPGTRARTPPVHLSICGIRHLEEQAGRPRHHLRHYSPGPSLVPRYPLCYTEPGTAADGPIRPPRCRHPIRTRVNPPRSSRERTRLRPPPAPAPRHPGGRRPGDQGRATDLLGGLGRPPGAARPGRAAVPARVHLARRRAGRGQGHQHPVHRPRPRHHRPAGRHQRPAHRPAGGRDQERRQDGRRPRGHRPAARGAARPAVPRRRHRRRVPAHQGAGGVPQAVLPRHARRCTAATATAARSSASRCSASPCCSSARR